MAHNCEMSITNILSIIIIYLLLLACDGRQKQMSSLIERADSMNRAYIPLTDSFDSLLLEAVSYYTRYGTSNEQVRAHYLLGCAHRDMGEAPHALQCFQDAVDCADTLSPDCDYGLLCRVHGQMAEILSSQDMSAEAVKENRLSTRYAWMAGDTLSAILSMGHLASDYYGTGN